MTIQPIGVLKKRLKQSPLERKLDMQMQEAGLPEFVEEYKFCPERRWRFDRANLEYKVAVEVEGGVWNRGRHTRPIGFIKDCEKYNTASSLGWLVVRVSKVDIEGGKIGGKYVKPNAVGMIKAVLKSKGWVEG